MESLILRAFTGTSALPVHLGRSIENLIKLEPLYPWRGFTTSFIIRAEKRDTRAKRKGASNIILIYEGNTILLFTLNN